MFPLVRACAFAAIGVSAACAAQTLPYPNTSNFGVPFSQNEGWYQHCTRVAQLSAPTMNAGHGAAPTCQAGDLLDAHGSGAAALSLAHQARLREQFMQSVLDAVSGKVPSSSASQWVQRDGELNTLYKAVMAAPSVQAGWPDRIGESTISHADVRTTERDWLAYRDAFVAFAASLPPGPDPIAIKTLLTSQRIAQLAMLARWTSS